MRACRRAPMPSPYVLMRLMPMHVQCATCADHARADARANASHARADARVRDVCGYMRATCADKCTCHAVPIGVRVRRVRIHARDVCGYMPGAAAMCADARRSERHMCTCARRIMRRARVRQHRAYAGQHRARVRTAIGRVCGCMRQHRACADVCGQHRAMGRKRRMCARCDGVHVAMGAVTRARSVACGTRACATRADHAMRERGMREAGDHARAMECDGVCAVRVTMRADAVHGCARRRCRCAHDGVPMQVVHDACRARDDAVRRQRRYLRRSGALDVHVDRHLRRDIAR